jgi:hypothetical protein
MATETIARTLAQGTTKPDTTHQLSGITEESERQPRTRGRDDEDEQQNQQMCAFLQGAFRRHLEQRLPPRDDGGDGGGGGGGDDDDPPGPDDPFGWVNGPPQNLIPIPQAADIKAMGSLPRIFDGTRENADAFLTEFLGYLMLNQGVPGFEFPIC